MGATYKTHTRRQKARKAKKTPLPDKTDKRRTRKASKKVPDPDYIQEELDIIIDKINDAAEIPEVFGTQPEGEVEMFRCEAAVAVPNTDELKWELINRGVPVILLAEQDSDIRWWKEFREWIPSDLYSEQMMYKRSRARSTDSILVGSKTGVDVTWSPPGYTDGYDFDSAAMSRSGVFSIWRVSPSLLKWFVSHFSDERYYIILNCIPGNSFVPKKFPPGVYMYTHISPSPILACLQVNKILGL